ncbi:hypothetical protein Pan44_16270 [Caulifigura coniformis]|uniref:Uncharacterized protein n=1 Tax=Caulifigura coniformis TaxID=2527983 RepID=A0A517SBW4_9PLAN|nr:hypothetical protein [Caulifigura coniformis]QDT53605.1 hypothetical protein Pan44_16270 [Caulifigura coniformis]
MQTVITEIITADATSIVAVWKIIDRIRERLPASGRPRRDEVVGALSELGYRLIFTGGCLHASGCRLSA